ncbi:TPA: hypothetical protein BOS_7024 [Bos taurus]|nr:TPA: hypothetical protein BOS_7024 [Bos taurus]
MVWGSGPEPWGRAPVHRKGAVSEPCKAQRRGTKGPRSREPDPGRTSTHTSNVRVHCPARLWDLEDRFTRTATVAGQRHWSPPPGRGETTGQLQH